MIIQTTKCLFLGLALGAVAVGADDLFAQAGYPAGDVAAQVEEAVWRFYAADTSRDAEAVIALLSPEFYMFADGNRTGYQEVVDGTRRFMNSITLFHTVWTDLRITTLGPDHAVSSFTFRDSIRTVDGLLPRKQGPTTFVWERADDGWRLLYADADHYPVVAP